MPIAENSSDWIKAEEAAKIVGVSKTTIQNWVRYGTEQIRTKTVDRGQYMYKPDVLEVRKSFEEKNRLISLKDAAGMLGVGQSTLATWTARGRVKSVHWHKSTLYDPKEIKRLKRTKFYKKLGERRKKIRKKGPRGPRGSNIRNDSDLDPYLNLSGAVVKSVIVDYAAALKNSNECQIESCEKWLHDKWCHLLTLGALNADDVVSRMRKEAGYD